MILPQGTWVVKGKRDWLMKVFTIRTDTWIVKTGHENTAIHTYPRCNGRGTARDSHIQAGLLFGF